MFKHQSAFTLGTARVVRSAVLTGLFVSALGACGNQQAAQAPTVSSTDETVTYSVPDVKAVTQGSEMQQKKNLIVSVVPMPFQLTDTPSKDCVPGPEQSSGGFLGELVTMNKNAPTKKPYVVTSTTGVNFSPKTLTFQVKVTNHTDQVMRLDSAVPKMIINDNEVVVSDDDAKKLAAGVLVPNESHSFLIAGPDWAHNPDEAIINFSLYSMPVEIDKTGVASKDNFTWTFAAKLEKKTTQATRKVENLMLDANETATMHCHPGAVAAN